MASETVPTYSAEGKRLRNYSAAALELLAATGRVALERNRKGRITCAHLRPADGSNPIRSNAHMGQSYSFAEQLPSGHRAWSHARLVDTRDLPEMDVEAAERFVRNVFLAVPLSVLTKTPAAPLAPVIDIGEYRERSKRLAPVISIDSFQRKPKGIGAISRPIEFDSERRAA